MSEFTLIKTQRSFLINTSILDEIRKVSKKNLRSISAQMTYYIIKGLENENKD